MVLEDCAMVLVGVILVFILEEEDIITFVLAEGATMTVVPTAYCIVANNINVFKNS